MKRKYLLLVILLVLIINACTPSSESLARKHLELIKAGKVGQANQQYCIPSDILRLHTVNSFKITSSQQKKQDNLPYTEVIASIDTDQYRYKNIDRDGIQLPQKEVLQQITIEVWKSDDFYQEVVKAQANLNDVANSAEALTGIQSNVFSTPEREEVNKEASCIFLPFDQFESDES